MKIVNMTAQLLNIYSVMNPEHPVHILPPSGQVITYEEQLNYVVTHAFTKIDFYRKAERVCVKIYQLNNGGFDLTSATVIKNDLPDLDLDTVLVVDEKIRLAFPDRFDLASPGAKKLNDQGKVIGYFGLIINPRRGKI